MHYIVTVRFIYKQSVQLVQLKTRVQSYKYLFKNVSHFAKTITDTYTQLYINRKTIPVSI